MKLDVKAFGLACGILWGAACLFLGATAMVCSWAQPFVNVLGTMYIGYTATVVGVIAGTIWGFLDGAIGGALLAWLYNALVPRVVQQ